MTSNEIKIPQVLPHDFLNGLKLKRLNHKPKLCIFLTFKVKCEVKKKCTQGASDMKIKKYHTVFRGQSLIGGIPWADAWSPPPPPMKRITGEVKPPAMSYKLHTYMLCLPTQFCVYPVQLNLFICS